MAPQIQIRDNAHKKLIMKKFCLTFSLFIIVVSSMFIFSFILKEKTYGLGFIITMVFLLFMGIYNLIGNLSIMIKEFIQKVIDDNFEDFEDEDEE